MAETSQNRGHESYGSESVAQLQHALECALLAREAQSSPQLVCAALLHDIGHILGDDRLPEGVDVVANYDDRHRERVYALV